MYEQSTDDDSHSNCQSLSDDNCGSDDVLSDSESDNSDGSQSIGKGKGKGKGKKRQFEVGMLFPSIDMFRDALRDYVAQEGFQLVWEKNERTRISTRCGSQGCPWRIHAFLLPNGITFKIKTNGVKF